MSVSMHNWLHGPLLQVACEGCVLATFAKVTVVVRVVHAVLCSRIMTNVTKYLRDNGVTLLDRICHVYAFHKHDCSILEARRVACARYWIAPLVPSMLYIYLMVWKR